MKCRNKCKFIMVMMVCIFMTLFHVTNASAAAHWHDTSTGCVEHKDEIRDITHDLLCNFGTWAQIGTGNKSTAYTCLNDSDGDLNPGGRYDYNGVDIWFHEYDSGNGWVTDEVALNPSGNIIWEYGLSRDTIVNEIGYEIWDDGWISDGSKIPVGVLIRAGYNGNSVSGYYAGRCTVTYYGYNIGSQYHITAALYQTKGSSGYPDGNYYHYFGKEGPDEVYGNRGWTGGFWIGGLASSTYYTCPGHDHSWAFTHDSNATCTSNGTGHYYCTWGGCTSTKGWGTVWQNALGHDWAWVHDTNATCTSPGYQHQYCKRCNAKQNWNTIWQNALGHSWPSGFSYATSAGVSNGEAFKNCKRCNVRLDTDYALYVSTSDSGRSSVSGQDWYDSGATSTMTVSNIAVGYKFNGWRNNVNGAIDSYGTSFSRYMNQGWNYTAQIAPRTDIKYKVRHYYQLDGTDEEDYNNAYYEVLPTAPSNFTATDNYTNGTSDANIPLSSVAWVDNADYSTTVKYKYKSTSYNGDLAHASSASEIVNNVKISPDGTLELCIYHTLLSGAGQIEEPEKVNVTALAGNGVASVSQSIASDSQVVGDKITFGVVLKDGYHWDVNGNTGVFAFGPATKVSNGTSKSGWAITKNKVYDADAKLPVYNNGNRTEITNSNASIFDNTSFTVKVAPGYTTLTAYATNNKYTLHYNANVPAGSYSTLTGNTGDTYCLYDVDMTFPDCGWSLAGYDFVGWADSPNNTGDSWNAREVTRNITDGYGLTNTDGATIQMYAIWKPRTDTKYEVHHWLQNVGDGTDHAKNYTEVTADVVKQTATTDTSIVVNTNAYDGFHPAQITTNDNGVNRVQNYPYSYGDNPTPNQSMTIQIDGDGVTRVDFWYDRTFYYFGTSDGFLNGDVGVDSTEHHSLDTSHHGWYQYQEHISISAIMKLGYDWVNWTNDTASNAFFASVYNGYKFTMPSHALSLTANTKAHVFSISYEYDGGEVNPANKSEYTVETKPFTLVEPVKLGYTLIGWTGDETYTDMFGRKGSATWDTIPKTLSVLTKADKFVVTPATSSPKSPNWLGVGARNYKAEYMAHQYYINYDANVPAGCTSTLVGSMANTLHSYDNYWRVPRAGAVTKLSKNAYSLTGYTWVCWNTKPDGSGTTITDEYAIKNMSSEDGDTVKLYAQWKAHEYEVALYSNDKEVAAGQNNAGAATGESAVNSDIQAYLNSSFNNTIGKTLVYDNQATNINANPNRPFATKIQLPLMEGYEASADGIYVLDTIQSTITGVTSTYYRLATDSELANAAIHKYEVKTSRRLGFNFLGWNTLANGTGKTVDVNLNTITNLNDGEEIKNLTSIEAGKVKLYAQWEPKTFTLVKSGSTMYKATMSTTLYTEKVSGLGIPSFEINEAPSISLDDCVIQYEIDENGNISSQRK